VCANDGLIVSSAAVIDCTVRIELDDESDVGHKNQIAAIAMIVPVASATALTQNQVCSPRVHEHLRDH
jgi:hypothetical protein